MNCSCVIIELGGDTLLGDWFWIIGLRDENFIRTESIGTPKLAIFSIVPVMQALSIEVPSSPRFLASILCLILSSCNCIFLMPSLSCINFLCLWVGDWDIEPKPSRSVPTESLLSCCWSLLLRVSRSWCLCLIKEMTSLYWGDIWAKYLKFKF